MKDKWNNKKEVRQQSDDGQPVGQRIALFPDTYRPKLLKKAPSLKAINAYNSIKTDTDASVYDNLAFISGSGNYDHIQPYASSKALSDDYYTYSNDHTLTNGEIVLRTLGSTRSNEDVYDYPTCRSSSIGGTNTSFGGSEQEIDKKEDLGSTAKLVSSKNGRVSCCSWFTYIETVLCTISLAAGLGNLYRLPQNVLVRGGVPFLIAYLVLIVLVGLPLLFLELGLGQLSQEGFTKTWRVVPLFRGVGYVKLIAGCLLGLYYPLYMGLFVYYIIWLAKGGAPPFTECAHVKMKESGYTAVGSPGQDCLQETFLESAFRDPNWYGIYLGILFLVWLVIMLLSLKRTKTYVISLIILLVPTVGCLVALIVKSILEEINFDGLQKLFQNIDWALLGSANVWYYAAIQVFFSTNVGFGSFVTNAAVIHNKSNVFWTAIGYIFINVVFGLFTVLLTYMLSGEVPVTPSTNDTIELHFASFIYNVGKNYSNSDAQIWTILAYCALLFSGFISMVSLVFTVIKAIDVETRKRWDWWQVALILSFFGFVFGGLILLCPNFDIVHLLDHYVVGILILITIIIEVFTLALFYGSKRIQSDFEFTLGKSLSKLWIMLWWCAPIILLGVLVWMLSTTSLIGAFKEDPVWLYATGWGIVLTSLLFIFAMSCYQIHKQEEYYTFKDKLKAVTKPSRKWGPVDPIMRYGWVQWHSKAKDGQRDFTLKRRGTRDYTHSITRNKKKEPYGKKYATTISEASTVSRSPSIVRKNDQNQNNIRITNVNSEAEFSRMHENYERPLRVTSLVDSFEPPPSLQIFVNNRNTYDESIYKTNFNPLSHPNAYNGDAQNESSTSEGYGTFRKGPYILSNDNIDHVCYRKYSSSIEEATEL